MDFSQRVQRYYHGLKLPSGLPEGVEVLNPYPDTQVGRVVREFYDRYFSDNRTRRLILGINPGRHGAGITGIPFTDPVQLTEACGITHTFEMRAELSSSFVYQLVNRLGGPVDFYHHFYIGSVSPLGFVKDGKNFNYYDSLEMKRTLMPFITESLVSQITFGIDTSVCYCMGQGSNFEYLHRLNTQLKLFRKIVPLPHPRWVMQYRRKEMEKWIDTTVRLLLQS